MSPDLREQQLRHQKRRTLAEDVELRALEAEHAPVDDGRRCLIFTKRLRTSPPKDQPKLRCVLDTHHEGDCEFDG